MKAQKLHVFFYHRNNMKKHIIHLFNESEKYNTKCWRKSILSSHHEKYVNCKKCLWSIRMRAKNELKRHLIVNPDWIDYKYYETACHTIGWKLTQIPEAVTCIKCLYIINRSIIWIKRIPGIMQ